jgi:hypothetical protein
MDSLIKDMLSKLRKGQIQVEIKMNDKNEKVV